MTKMRILFDAGSLMNSQKSGVGYYTKGLVTALATKYADELELTGYYHNFLGRKRIHFDIDLPNVRFKPIRYFPGIILSPLSRILGIQLPIEVLVWRPYDVHLFPNFISLPSLRRTPSIVVIHDLAYLDYPQYIQGKNLVYLQRLLPRCIRRASAIFTVSEFTKQAVREHFHPTAPITVTHTPPLRLPNGSNSLQQRLTDMGIHSKKYIMFLGNIEPRKNLVTLLKAYAALPANLRQQYSLVLTGGKGWNDDEINNLVQRLQSESHSVILPGYVSDEEKDALYANAYGVVLPAYHEGFGMPALEAIVFHAPVLLSDIPAFREIAGEHATYFDPNSVEELTGKLQTFLEGDVKTVSEADYQRLLTDYNWPLVAERAYTALKELKP
jgi:glycosyltransferase involved in cell wall biosynthesis